MSTLIVTNQLSRNEAIKKLELNPYSNNLQLNEDKEYFLKKMNWTQEKLEEYLKRPAISHTQYANSKFIYENLLKYTNYLNKVIKKKLFLIHNHKNFSGAARSLGETVISLRKKWNL